MATKRNPGEFDCYANALPHEPLFVLLARDEAAPDTIAYWCRRRIALGKNTPGAGQIVEALHCAETMCRWRQVHHGPHAVPEPTSAYDAARRLNAVLLEVQRIVAEYLEPGEVSEASSAMGALDAVIFAVDNLESRAAQDAFANICEEDK